MRTEVKVKKNRQSYYNQKKEFLAALSRQEKIITA
jgi:hypothetical protein